MPEQYKQRFQVLSAGHGGITGYENPVERYGAVVASHSEIPDRRLTCYLGELIEGGYVVDERPALMGDDAFSISWHCPMLSLKLKDRQVDRCPKPSQLMLFGLQGSFKAMAAARCADESYSGLDSVPLSVWLGYWRKHGARIGQRQGNKIVWEDGEETAIPPFGDRWEVIEDAWREVFEARAA